MADIAQNAAHTLDLIAFANENSGNYMNSISRAAKTANPELVTSGFLGMSTNYNTKVEDLQKIDQTLAAEFGANSVERLSFHVTMGRGDELTVDAKGNAAFPTISEQGIASFNKALEGSMGTYNGFDKAVAFEAKETGMSCDNALAVVYDKVRGDEQVVGAFRGLQARDAMNKELGDMGVPNCQMTLDKMIELKDKGNSI